MTKRNEDKITASEMRYRRLFESAKDGIIILDATSGQVQDANPFLLDLLGYTLKDLLGKELWEIGLFQDISESRAAFRELQDNSYIRYEDLPLETRDGRHIEVEFVSNVYLVNDEKVIQCNIRDITERRRTEQAITASEMRYRRLFESAKDGIIILDATSGQVQDANPFLLDLLGYSLEDLLGKELWEIGLFADISTSRAAFRELQDNSYIRYEDLPLETRDGRHIEVEFVSNVYLVNDEKVIQCNIRDITERRRTEQAITASEMRYRMLVEQASDGIFIANSHGQYIQVNSAGCLLLDYTREEIFEKTISDLTKADPNQPLRLEELRQGKTLITNREMVRKDGSLVPVEISAKMLSDGGFQAIVRDITERVRAEESLRKSEALLTQMSGIAKIGAWELNAQTMELTWTEEVYRIHEVDMTYRPTLEEAISFYAPKSRPIIEKAVRRAIERAEAFDLQLEFMTAKGNHRWVHAQGMIHEQPEEARMVFGTFHDITERKLAETRIRKLHTAVEQSGNSVVITDLQGTIEYVNRKFTEVTGYTRVEVIGKNPSILKSGESSTEVYKELWETIFGGDVWEGEFHNRKKNGELFWEWATISPIKDESGDIVNFLAVKEDITQRKLDEEKISQSEAALNQAQRVARLGSWLWHIQSNQLEWSDEMYRIFCIDKDTFSGELSEVIERAIHPDDREVVNKANASVINDKTPTPLEYRIIDPDGAVKVVWAEAGEMILDSVGNPMTLTGIVQDITERKQMEMALEQERTLLRTLIDHLPDRIYAKDIEGRFTIKNKADARQMGAASTTEVIGKTDFDYYPSALATQYQTDDQIVIQSGQSLINREEVFLNSDGNSGWMLTTKVPLKDSQGKVIGLVGIGRDITERKNAEEKLAKVNRTLALISSVNQSIVHIRLLTELFETVCRIAVEIGSFHMAWIGLLDSETMRVNPVAHGGVAEDYLEMLDIVLDDDDPRGHGPTATALRTGEPVIVNNIAQDPSMTPWRENALRLGYYASAAFPLNFAGEMRGVLNLYANQTDFFDDEEVDQLSEMAADISFAMEFAENEAQRQQALIALEQHAQAVEAMRLFLQTTLDAFPANTAVLDPGGIIINVNAPWIRFADENGAPSPMHYWGANYLTVCDMSRGANSEEASLTADGIKAVIDGTQDHFYLEYPCHSPSEKRWFVLRVTPFPEPAPRRVVVAHVNITQRMLATELLAEQKVQLTERVKELNGLYTLAKLMEEVDPHLDTLFQAAVELIPATMQYPDITCACLTVEDRSYTTSNFRTTPWQIVSPVTVNSGQVGVLAIYYLEEQPLQFEGPFLKEERLLIDEFARSLGNKIVTLRAEVALREAHDKLESKVLERTAELQMSKERVEAILNSSADAILLVEDDFRIQQTNASFNSLFASEQDDYIGKSLNALLGANDTDSMDMLLQAAAEQSRLAVDVEARRKNNTVFAAELSIGFIRGDSFVCTFHDISERKQFEQSLQSTIEKEKELNELKTRFVSMASHEFRTPLATIHATTETLSTYRHKLTEDQIELKLSNIRGQVGYLKDIMDDVLRLAQLQMRQVAFKPETVDFDALCREVIDEFQTRTDVTHALIYTCESAVPSAHLDKKLMRQLVSNLVSNAIKYSPQDKTIMLNLEYTSQTLVFSVQDSGIGIPEDDLKHLFEPFHRAANVGTIHGTGLGLVIAKESVELHGGTITVESQLGAGTTFTVHIPIKTQGE